MQTFISNVISDVLKANHKPIKDVVFVLPSQRAGVFLKQELIKQLNSSSFLPQILSIENFIETIADIRLTDNVELLFEFYTVYKKHTEKEELQSFDMFSQWASIVLQDFNDLDRQLVDTDQIFTYLRDINRLKNWSPSTIITQNYFHFFEKLNLYYQELNNSLKTKGLGYQGLIYREAEHSIQHYINNNDTKHIVFVGFNALTKAEEHIIQELLESNMASIYWDIDQSYLEPNNEIGKFVKSYKKNWKYFEHNSFNWIEKNLDFSDKYVEIIGTPKNINQLKKVGEILNNSTTFDNTAIVLADESILSPALNSLPKKVDKINITMGFPLKDIPLNTLFSTVIELFQNQQKFDLLDDNKFYYKDILQLYNDSYFRKLIQFNPNFSDNLGQRNRLFLNTKDLIELFGIETYDVISFLFENTQQNTSKLIEDCIQICLLLKDKTKGLEREYVYRFYTIFQQLATLNKTYGYITELNTLNQFFKLLVQNESLSFLGEPLEGLQLMGMLETRVIDFETVIITSVNEGILPKSKSDQSFIPFDVRREFELPTYHEKDAIFGYHFYRLLHRAKNIYLLYNTENDSFGSGEKSRFITQLELKLKNYKSSLVAPKVKPEKPSLQEIPKTKQLLESLKELAGKGFSPSSIASYVNNPIDFYYTKVLGIKETKNVEETVAFNTLGTVIHAVLEQLYLPFKGKFLTEEVMKSMRKQAPDLVHLNFKKEYKNGAISSGKNKLIFEVTKKLIDKFLLSELNAVKNGKQIKIIDLEQKLSCSLDIDGFDFPVKIHGIIDRVDEVDGVLRIVDYKSGMVEHKNLKISDFGLIREDYKYSKALQVMLYAFMYTKENPQTLDSPIEAGIYSLKNIKSGFIQMNFSAKRNEKDNHIAPARLKEFITEFKHIIIELFNPEIPFKENPDKKEWR